MNERIAAALTLCAVLSACGTPTPAPSAREPVPVADAAVPDGPPAPDVDAILRAGCATTTERRSLLPSNLLFVIDRSQSMSCNPPPTTDSPTCEEMPVRANVATPSKWEIMRSVLHDAITELPPDLRVGLSYFSNDESCGVHSLPNVEIAPLSSAQREALRASLDAVEPGGGSPLVGATILAYQHLHQRALAGALRGNKYVVLLTDGGQSDECYETARCDSGDSCAALLVSSEVPKAAGVGVGIRTFVIGAPGSEFARPVLSRIASAGGTGKRGCDGPRGDCHFDMTLSENFDSSLSEAIERIVEEATPCELALPAAEAGVDVDPDFVNVIYSPGDGADPVLVSQRDAEGCAGEVEGWHYDATGVRIKLCGAICDTVREDGAGRVDVVLGCRTEGPQ